MKVSDTAARARTATGKQRARTKLKELRQQMKQMPCWQEMRDAMRAGSAGVNGAVQGAIKGAEQAQKPPVTQPGGGFNQLPARPTGPVQKLPAPAWLDQPAGKSSASAPPAQKPSAGTTVQAPPAKPVAGTSNQAPPAKPSVMDVAGGGKVAGAGLAGTIDDKVLKGTGMAGQGAVFVEASQRYGVPVEYLLGMVRKESSFLSPENTLSVPNRNPANLRFAEWEREHGGAPGKGGFTAFPTVADGIRAQAHLLAQEPYASMVKAGDWRGVVHRWAPPSDGNDSDLYARQLITYAAEYRQLLGVGA